VPREFVPVDHGRLELIANYLRRAAAVEAFYGDADLAWQGVAGSIAEADRTYFGPASATPPWPPRVMSTVYASARIGLTAVAEQALAIAQLIIDPTIGVHGVLGVEVCCRSAVEIGARSWWLLDPTTSAHDRTARYLADQLYSAYEAEKLAAAMGWMQPVNVIGISPSSADLLTKITELGMVAGGTKNNPEVDGQRRPTSTDLVAMMLRSTPYGDSRQMIYRLLSATTHGTMYSLMRSFRPIDETFNGEPMLGRMADQRVIESAAGVTLTSFIAILERIVQLAGWSHWRCTSFRNMAYSVFATGPT
jgi:hypothetical protein